MSRMTRVYSGNQKPVRVGVYRRRSIYGAGLRYSYWNGKYWCANGATIQIALQCIDVPSLHQSLPWQGLRKEGGK